MSDYFLTRTSWGVRPAGLSACGSASCSHICAGLGARAGVVGTSLCISTCLGLVSRRHAQLTLRGQFSILEMGQDTFWVLDGCLQMRVPEPSPSMSNHAAGDSRDPEAVQGSLSALEGLLMCVRSFV